MSHTRIVFVFLAGQATLLAQGQYGAPPPIQSQLVAPIYGRAIVGNLSGHDLPDVVMLASGELQGAPVATAVLVTAPGIHSAVNVLPGTSSLLIRDVATIPGGDPAHHRDALALVSDGGLYRWTAGGTLQRYGGNLWNNCSRVAIGDVDGDELPDAIGVMANGQNVRRQAFGGSGTTWFLDTGSLIQDLLVTDWAANALAPADDIVVAQADRILFLVDGRIQHALTVPLPVHATSFLAALDDGNGAKRLAVAFADAGVWQLVTIGNDGSPMTVKTLPGAVAGMTRVDRATGADGVVVTWASGAQPTEFTLDGSMVGFGAGSDLLMTLGTNTATACALRLDIDADGDLDSLGMSDTAGLLRLSDGAEEGVHVYGIGPQLAEYTFGGPAPAWATGVEATYFQIQRVSDEGQLVGLDLEVAAKARTVTPIGNGLPFSSIPVSMPVGPIVTVLRFVEQQNGVTVRRGSARPVLWTVNNAERAMIALMLYGQPVLYDPYPPEGGIGASVEPPVIPPPPPDDDPPEGDPDGNGG